MKKLTIAVCTYNRSKILKLCIDSIIKNNKNFDDYVILVIDNNSSDDTAKSINEYSFDTIKYIFEEKQGLSNARNRALRECETDLITFIDDDVVVEKDYVKNILNRFKEDNLVCAGGKIYSIWEEDKPKWYNEGFYSIIGETQYGDTYREMKKYEFPYGGNMIFKMSIFDKIGKFDPNMGIIGDEIIMGEEVEVCTRIKKLGIEIKYIPEAIVGHRVHMNKINKKYINERWIQEGIATGKIVSNQKIFNKFICYFKRIAILLLRDYPSYIIYNLANKDKSFYWFAKKNRSIALIKNITFYGGKI